MIKEKYLKALELDKVLDMLAQETCCPAARDLALSIRPETDLDEVLRSLKRTDDAFSLTLRADDRTLTVAESEEATQKILAHLQQELGAVLR